MSCNASYIVKKIVDTGALDGYCDLTHEQMLNHNVGEDSGDFVFDGLIKIITSYCSDDTETMIFRKINNYIERL